MQAARSAFLLEGEETPRTEQELKGAHITIISTVVWLCVLLLLVVVVVRILYVYVCVLCLLLVSYLFS